MTTAAPSIYVAVADLERHYGGAFVYAPQRWGTADGTISYCALYVYADQLRRQLASERLHLARAQFLSSGTQHAAEATRADQRIAHGAA